MRGVVKACCGEGVGVLAPLSGEADDAAITLPSAATGLLLITLLYATGLVLAAASSSGLTALVAESGGCTST